ncbi:carbonic anhydrase [Trifolium repens]|nr:carbonic anhydrase [Trifolium repens]
MANQSSELAIEKLKNLLREKEELNEVVTTKIEELIVELQGSHQPHPIDPAQQRIIDGFTHFKLNNFDKNPELHERLAKGPSAKFMVFACSDPRVSPSTILNFQLGEAFVVRNIANMVPAFNQLRYSGVGATIEFAIEVLKVENILVIGHATCGGIPRLMSHPEDGSTPYDFIDDWVKIGLAAKIKVLREHEGHDFKALCKFCELESVNNSLVNLYTYPGVDREIKKGNLALLGGYYDLVNGEFKLWKYNTVVTKPITIPLKTNDLTV